MKRVIINASAAKLGGAKVILESFIAHIPENSKVEYILISNLDLPFSNPNITQKKKSTSGLGSLLFSVFGIVFYQLRYHTTSVLSFNNINSIYGTSKCVTYFHQLKALSPEVQELKVRIYRKIIKHLNKKNTFIVQTDFVKELFLKEFDLPTERIVVCWPGFVHPEESLSSENSVRLETQSQGAKIGIIPVAFDTQHKNLKLLNQLHPFLEAQKIQLYTLLKEDGQLINHPNIKHLRSQSRSQLFDLYRQADFMLFTSSLETVGLPIFEFLETGKPVFVYAADYIVKLQKQFNSPENLILFKTVAEFESLFSQYIDIEVPLRKYSEGEWNKILELI